MIHKNMKVKVKEKVYDIEYKQTKNVLYFNDKDGASIGFVKGYRSLGVYVNDRYSNPKMWIKYPRLKGTNAYALSPEQIKIFLNWLKM